MLSKKAIANFSDYFGLDFAKQLSPVPHKRTKGKHLFIADTHCPCHSKLLDKTIEDNTDADTLIIAGDWFDFYSKSFYRKRKNISFRDEFRQGYWKLQDVARHFDKVYIMLTNHDERFKKFLFDNVPPDCLAFCNVNLIEDFINLIPNVKIVNQKTRGDRSISYVWQYKNVLFSHIEKSSVVLSKVVQDVEQHIMFWNEYYNLKNIDIIIQAHNHQAGKVESGTKTLFQIPCLINIDEYAFDYVFDGKAKGKPNKVGYMTAYLEDDKFDSNKMNYHVYR